MGLSGSSGRDFPSPSDPLLKSITRADGPGTRSMASRGGFTRQPVNIPCFEALTKVRPVRSPVRTRQATRQVWVRRHLRERFGDNLW